MSGGQGRNVACFLTSKVLFCLRHAHMSPRTHYNTAKKKTTTTFKTGNNNENREMGEVLESTPCQRSTSLTTS